jgi:hypothetical protein
VIQESSYETIAITIDPETLRRLDELAGMVTQVIRGPEDGLPWASAFRCDFLTIMFKASLSDCVSALSPARPEGAGGSLP